MKILTLLLLTASICSAAHVIVLDDDTFTQKITDYSAALVKFYVPWCGHCKNIAPEFEKAAYELKTAKSPITLIEVDCSENGKVTCSIFRVKAYPSLKVFKYGEMVSEYSGPKHAEGIVQQMKSTVLPGSKELKTVAEADVFLSSLENCVLGFFEPNKPKIEIEFHRLADSLKDHYRFAHTYHNRLLSRYGYRNEIVIMRAVQLQNKLEPPHVKFEGEASLYRLRSWVTENYYGLVGIRTMMNIDEFRRPLVIVYYKLDFDGKNSKESSYWRNRVMLMARKLSESGKKKVHFAVSDVEEFHREMKDLGLNYVDDSPVVAARDSREQRYIMNTSFSIENLEQFVDDLLTGALRPYVKSEPVPESNEGPVKVVVADNFNDIVTSHDKHVFIYFHSPWCGECPEVEKTVKLLAAKVTADTITLASMDATKNDVPKQFVIKSFPAVFLVRKDLKMMPKLFEGKYEVDELLKFLTAEVSEVVAQNKSRKTESDSLNKVKTEL